MTKTLLIDALHPEETRVAVIDADSLLDDFDCEMAGRKQITGNVYIARVVRVEPALQAAFLEYGNNRQGFLSLSELHPDCYADARKRAPLVAPVLASADDDADDDESARPRIAASRQIKIQDVLKRRQLLLVQAVKEERGNKGAAFTTYVNLPGRYGIYMPNTPRGIGVSKKIVSAPDRQRLKEILLSFGLTAAAGFIVRTAGGGRTKAEIKRDYEYLTRLWDNIVTASKTVTEPGLIYEESNLVKRSVRDMYGKDITAIHVQGDVAYREAKEFMKMLAPSHAKNVFAHKISTPIFAHYGLEAKLENLFSPTVALPSGGSLVIHHTEALVAIDVNSGRSTRENSVEETAHKTNLEAATEAARQMRLRDLAGLIVIDFIDMQDPNNVKNVEKRLKDALKGDRSRVQIGRISSFGLLEMSRQRLRPGVSDIAALPCPHCRGTGRLRALESFVLSVLRQIDAAAQMGRVDAVQARVHPDIATYLLNKKRRVLVDLEQQRHMSIEIVGDHTMLDGMCQISTTLALEAAYDAAQEVAASLQHLQQQPPLLLEAAAPALEIPSPSSEPLAENENDDTSTRRRRRGGRGRGRGRDAVTDDATPAAVVIPVVNNVLAANPPIEYRDNGQIMLILEQRNLNSLAAEERTPPPPAPVPMPPLPVEPTAMPTITPEGFAQMVQASRPSAERTPRRAPMRRARPEVAAPVAAPIVAPAPVVITDEPAPQSDVRRSWWKKRFV